MQSDSSTTVVPLCLLSIVLLALLCAPLAGVREVQTRFGSRRSSGNPASFACVDFVCVNQFEVALEAVGSHTFDSFASCAQSCVSSMSWQPAGSHLLIATTPFTLQPPPTPPPPPPPTLGSMGYVVVGNRSLDAALVAWLDARHRLPCDASTPVYFAPFSPNGIGNKLMAIVMAFHMALMQGRRLVVSDWPPRTLDTEYSLEQILHLSSCQPLFDRDPARARVVKCTVIACPSHTASVFEHSYTQPHWAHMSPLFLEVPPEWAHLDWLTWWRALTQYLLRPGARLLEGLAATLARITMLRSTAVGAPDLARAEEQLVLRANAAARADAARDGVGFADRFAAGVARWGAVRRPLIGVHVRLGDGCWDSKRGGCKYVRSFATVLTRLRQAGLTHGTIFLATDNSTIAEQAVAAPSAGFDVLALGEDRKRVEKSHARGDRRRERDELLHLQLLDLALLSQADVLAGVFGSTFVKSALQLGRSRAYISLDTFPWCPLLRCYWGWRDLCHNCELCYNSGGGGEACNSNGYHTAGGLARVLAHKPRGRHAGRAAFRRFIASVERDFQCRAFAEHPIETSMYDAPVVGSHYAPSLSTLQQAARRRAHPPRTPAEVCAVRGAAAAEGGEGAEAVPPACACGFRRFEGVDNAAAAMAMPAYGYAHGFLTRAALEVLARRRVGAANEEHVPPTLADCEAACCDEPLCHSVTWKANTSQCVAGLAIAYGARLDDWCWHPMAGEHATTSIRLPGRWQSRAVAEAQSFLRARTLIRARGAAAGPRRFHKAFSDPPGHSRGPMEREMSAESSASACDATSAAPTRVVMAGAEFALSDVVAAAVPLAGQPHECTSQLHPRVVRTTKQGQHVYGWGDG